MNFANGASYIGEFSEGKRNGLGTYFFSNNYSLEINDTQARSFTHGNWENDQLNGFNHVKIFK